MALVTLAVGLIATGLGVYYLYRPRLQLFYQFKVFHREDGEIGPAERTLGRLAAAVMLAIGLFIDWLWLGSVGVGDIASLAILAIGLVAVWLGLRSVG